MDAFREARIDGFRRKLREHISGLPKVKRERWTPERIASEGDAAVAQGGEYHLTRESDIARLAEIFCGQLEGFSGSEVDPEGLNILYAYGVDPVEKLDRFTAYLNTAANREE